MIRKHVGGQLVDGLGRPLMRVESWVLMRMGITDSPGGYELAKEAAGFFGLVVGTGILGPIAGKLIGIRGARHPSNKELS